MTKTNIIFALKCFLACLGILAYILTNGTLLKAVVIYLLFTIISNFATVGYHRYITHNAVKPTTVGKYIFFFSIVAVGLLKPITYAIVHRAHHKHSDTDNDPHSPAVGFWRCLIGNYNHVDLPSSVRDLFRNKELVFINNNFWYLYLVTVAIFAIIDMQLMYLSFPFLVLRYHLQATIFNYIAHGGSKNTGPQNLNFIPGIFFWGEHLHLNHHLRQTNANHGRVSKINFDYMYYLLSRLKLINKCSG